MRDATERPIAETRRTAVRRKAERGSHERALINSILDEALICHVGFSDGDSTYVLPTTYARVGDVLYLHGASANHLLRTLASGVEACVTVTLLDGLVLARSAFHHSMNYRSVMLLGVGTQVEEPEEKLAAVLAIVEHVTPGRSLDARPPTASELRATLVVRMPIDEASAKVRSGPPIDDPEDLELEIWAGEIPLALAAGRGLPDEGLPTGLPLPSYAAHYPDRHRPLDRESSSLPEGDA